jgi:hypothetical protein
LVESDNDKGRSINLETHRDEIDTKYRLSIYMSTPTPTETKLIGI